MAIHLREESGEISPAAWLSGAAFALIPFGFLNRFVEVAAIIIAAAFGGVATLCLLAAGRQHFINVGARREAQRRKRVALIPPPVPPQIPAGPIVEEIDIEFVTCESRVVLVRRYGGYSRPPAEGDITSGAVAAFRHVKGRNVVITAHLRYARAEAPDIHVHSAAWVGASNGSVTLGASQTLELILAVHGNYGYGYVLDVGPSGMTHKELPFGTYDVHVALDFGNGHVRPLRFKLEIPRRREDMKIACTAINEV